MADNDAIPGDWQPTGLSGSERKQLQEALLSAFDGSGLEQVAAHHLDAELERIAGGQNLDEITFNLVRWANRNDRVGDLVNGAIAENPENQALQQLRRDLWNKERGAGRPGRRAAPWWATTRGRLALVGGILILSVLAVVALWLLDDDKPGRSFLFEDFTDTARWHYSRHEWVQPIFDPDTSNENAMLRFYPPGNNVTVEAYRTPMDDVLLRPYCAIQVRIRLNLQESQFSDSPRDAAVYLEQNGEKIAVALGDSRINLDQASTEWQTLNIPFLLFRGVDTNLPLDTAAAVEQFGFEFRLLTPGSTIDIDDVYFVTACD